MAERDLVVLLDRDGTICENRADHVTSWAKFKFLPGAVEALASLHQAGARLMLVTNQGAIGRGLMTPHELDDIHARMTNVLHGSGGDLDAIAICPHHPDDGCACRKPATGMLVDLARDRRFDLEEAYLVGDFVTDIEAGAAAGCVTVLVRTGRGKQAERLIAAGEGPVPDAVCDDLVDASFWILTDHASVGARGVRTAKDRRGEARKR